MTESHWRNKATEVIKAVIAEVGTDDEKALRSALRTAYPFGEKRYHPYKIWLDEIAVQLGKKPSADSRKRRERITPVDPKQQNLFDEESE